MPFPIIAPVRGRESDYLLTKTGRKVFGQSNVFDDYPDFVEGFQFVQHKDLSVTLKVVPKSGAGNKRVQEIFRHIQGLYKDVDMRLEIVDAIPHDAGKMRFIVRE